MIKELVELVFEQAKEETPNVTKTGLAKHLSKKIEENNPHKIFSHKTFTRYYDKYLLHKEGVIDDPQAEIIEELCRYLNYKNYQDYVFQQKNKNGNFNSLNKQSEIITKEDDKPLFWYVKTGNKVEFFTREGFDLSKIENSQQFIQAVSAAKQYVEMEIL